MDHIGANGRTEPKECSFDYSLDNLYTFFVDFGINAFTAFVRIDHQIKDLFDDYLYVLKKLPKSGFDVDIGWHPHCKANELVEIYQTLPVIKTMRSVRMGGAMMDNSIMASLVKMGFKVDSSAMPGCKRNDNRRKYDWSHCGNSTYYPGLVDYQSGGTPCHPILEVPMTTIPIQAPYGMRRRYINPTIKHEIFSEAFSRYALFLPFIVVIFHPDQLLEGYEDDLYCYGMTNFVENMKFMKSVLGEVEYQSLASFL